MYGAIFDELTLTLQLVKHLDCDIRSQYLTNTFWMKTVNELFAKWAGKSIPMWEPWPFT